MGAFRISNGWLYGWQLCENKKNKDLGLPAEERDAKTKVLISAITGIRESWDEDVSGNEFDCVAVYTDAMDYLFRGSIDELDKLLSEYEKSCMADEL